MVWHRILPLLIARGLTVYSPDVPGEGLSEELPDSAPKFIFFVKDFADALCLDKFHLITYAPGVPFAINHANRVTSAVFLNGGIPGVPGMQAIVKAAPLTKKELQVVDDGSGKQMRHILEISWRDHSAITDDVVAMATAHAIRNKDSHARMMAATIKPLLEMGKKGFVDEAMTKEISEGTSKLPVAYLYGIQDTITPPECGNEQEKALPHVQFFFTPAGHCGAIDAPVMYADVAAELFTRGKVSWKTAEAAGVSKNRPPLPTVVESAPA